MSIAIATVPIEKAIPALIFISSQSILLLLVLILNSLEILQTVTPIYQI